MNDKSLVLSSEELEIFTNPIFFQRKNHIAHAIISFLEKLNDQLENDPFIKEVGASFNLPPTRGKISKGENYLGYPWQILDYPRVFQKENVFAFRTLCWWGNYYSCTLHLAGLYFQNCKESLQENLHILINHPVYLCVNNQQWDHHHEENNYRLLKDVVLQQDLLSRLLSENDFIKLSCKFPLTEIERIEANALESFILFSKAITRIAKDQ